MPCVMCRGHQGEYLQSLSPFLRRTASFRLGHWALGPPWSSRIATSQNPFSIRHMEGTVTRNGSLDNQPIQNTDLDVGRPGVQILPCSLSAGKLWSNYLASPSWFSLLQNEDIQAATSQNDSHPCLPKPPDRRQRSPTAQRHFLKTWGAQRRKQPIHPGAAPNAAGSQHPEPSVSPSEAWDYLPSSSWF
ncbi:uncharacterized protein LOC104680769 isoform X2 [Rhinopithecus roxellana]|uniref:uncharacterized protein LOC104680769 isoform X2 n=1 Tax=Rhinopithecus roxellana TaxID=61622 RepID=UPI0012378B4E|nr:uncharacterized protein LOC104680769 isoform X2 [Rhinopithecus roxellana]